MSDKKSEISLPIVKVLSVLCAIVAGGFAWWMTTVWANQESQAKDITQIQIRLAGLESKINGVSSQVTDVKTGVDRLVKLALERKI